MVGNEEATITRMLESVVDHIDYYVIQCNGKKDNTQQIIDSFFADNGIPGFTYEIDWDFPGWNRDHTLQEALRAGHDCDWILRMDADEQLLVEKDFDWTIFTNTSIQSFNVAADPGDSMYFRTWMWNAKLPWFFAHDRRHETIHLPSVNDFQRVNLSTGFRHIITNDGETWYAPMKFLKDALELEMDKVTTGKVLEDNYHLFYIGKSYSDSYENPSQFPFGMDHAIQYASRAIFYFDMYLNQVHDYRNQGQARFEDEFGYYAMMLKADALKFIGNTDGAMSCYLLAEQFSPERSEHLERLGWLYESLSMFSQMAETCTKMLVKNNPFPNKIFLINNSSYPNTSAVPYWMHIRALRALKKDYSSTLQTLNSVHPNLPDYIKNDIYNS